LPGKIFTGSLRDQFPAERALWFWVHRHRVEISVGESPTQKFDVFAERIGAEDLPLSVDPGSIQLSQYYLLIFKRKT